MIADNNVEMAASQFGVMLFPDMPKAVSELIRIVTPGGRAVIVALRDPRTIDFFEFFVRGIQAVRPDLAGPPMDPPALPFQLQDPEILRRELARAGLKDVSIESLTETLKFNTAREFWAWVIWSNPVTEIVLVKLQLFTDEKAATERKLERLVGERAGDGEAAIRNVPINGVGIK